MTTIPVSYLGRRACRCFLRFDATSEPAAFRLGRTVIVGLLGAYVRWPDVWVCVVPMLPLHLRVARRGGPR